jgi:hypothetical protein
MSFAPWLANSIASASPMPEVAPVIQTTLFWKLLTSEK